MSKTLSAAALVVAQLLSWSGAPLYLCMSCDGSMRFDGGPDACCNGSHAGRQCASATSHEDHQHRCCQTDQAAERAQLASNQKLRSPCDCTHIRISQEQQLVAAYGSRVLPTEHAILAPVCDGLAVLNSALWPQASGPSTGPPAIDSGALNMLSSIILRC